MWPGEGSQACRQQAEEEQRELGWEAVEPGELAGEVSPAVGAQWGGLEAGGQDPGAAGSSLARVGPAHMAAPQSQDALPSPGPTRMVMTGDNTEGTAGCVWGIPGHGACR